MNHSNSFLDITDQRFGRLIAREWMGYNKKVSRWFCQCDCGNVKTVALPHLRNGHTKSCGCIKREQIIERNFRHGLSDTPTYYSWQDMIKRCENSNNKGYKNYGGRGITVCERWHKFENFFEDMGKRPEGLFLDRRNNNGNYNPNNCRWVTRKVQNNNKRPCSCGPNKQYWFYGHGPNGEMIIWNNLSKIAKEFNLNTACISGCINGRQKQTKDWTFQRI